MYGYQDDEVKSGLPYGFGLNPGIARLTQFQWIPNGGKDGAEQEALDIKFTIEGKEVSYRKFPVTSAFVKDSQEKTTDPNSEEFKEEVKRLTSTMTHIIGAFIDKEVLKKALERNIESFKHYCEILTSLLPAGFQNKPLDIFFEYQYTLKNDAKVTFLQLPADMKQGKWLAPAQAGIWQEKRNPGAADGSTAIWYENEKGEKHPFTRTGWYLKSNYANQQKQGDGNATPQSSAMAPTAGNEPTNTNGGAAW